MLAIGDTAPAFTLPDQSGAALDAKSLKGQRYLVYFYPKDSTPGCTLQACGLQSDLEQFNGLGIRVLDSFGLQGEQRIDRGANWRCPVAVFVIQRA